MQKETKQLIKRFKSKLAEDGRFQKWFVKNYLAEKDYTYFSAQINGWRDGKVCDRYVNAMKKYLKES